MSHNDEHHEHAHEAADPGVEVPADSESLQRFLALMDDIKRAQQELLSLLSDERLHDRLIASLASNPNFNRLVRNLALEAVAEATAQHDHPHETQDDPNVVGYQVRLSAEPTPFKAALTDGNHPTAPDSVEVFFGTEVDGQLVWQGLGLSRLAAKTVREAFQAEAVPPYAYRFFELTSITRAPLNADSVRAGAATDANS